MNVLCAGSPRSASTWLFNLIRIIFIQSNIVFKSSYIDKEIGFLENTNYIIKVHNFFPSFTDKFQIILTTNRDLLDIIASMIRMGWAVNQKQDIHKQANHIVSNYKKWKPYSNYEVLYERFHKNKIEVIKDIINIFKLKLDPYEIDKILNNINIPKNLEIDPITHYHRNHITDGGLKTYENLLSNEIIKELYSLYKNIPIMRFIHLL